MDTSLFRQFMSELLKDDGFIAVGDEAYIYGFDYTDKNIYFDRIGYETPSVIDLDKFDIAAFGSFDIAAFVTYLRKLPRYYRFKESSSGSTSKKRSSRKSSNSSSSNISEFVARKKLKKDIKKASSGCVDDVCVEV